MKIKAILFDLDGVLISMVEGHYRSLNMALKKTCNFEIDEEDHVKYYNGISTKAKLNILINRGIVKKEDYNKIWGLKQKYTLELIDNFKRDEIKVDMCRQLKSNGYKLACVSNSIRTSTCKMCNQIGISTYLDLILGNEDFKDKIKPNSYPYTLAFYLLKLQPKDCLIVEDSPKGLQAAYSSTANVMKVKNPDEVNYKNVIDKIAELE